MRTIKIILGLFFAVSVLVLIGIGYMWQSVLIDDEYKPAPVAEEAGTSTPPAEEPLTIRREELTDGQKRMLSALGIDAESLTITPEAMACAEREVGSERLAAYEEGESPTFSEGLILLACLRAE